MENWTKNERRCIVETDRPTSPPFLHPSLLQWLHPTFTCLLVYRVVMPSIFLQAAAGWSSGVHTAVLSEATSYVKNGHLRSIDSVVFVRIAKQRSPDIPLSKYFNSSMALPKVVPRIVGQCNLIRPACSGCASGWKFWKSLQGRHLAGPLNKC